MGRSVSYPNNCAAVAYQTFDCEDEYDCTDKWQWFVEYIQETVITKWPSFIGCDKWLGREDHAILENGHCYIGVSEYCGLVAIWLKPKDNNDHPEISESWCVQISNKFLKTFSEYRKVATASNGEAFFEKVTA